jgi:hypothetical protein
MYYFKVGVKLKYAVPMDREMAKLPYLSLCNINIAKDNQQP